MCATYCTNHQSWYLQHPSSQPVMASGYANFWLRWRLDAYRRRRRQWGANPRGTRVSTTWSSDNGPLTSTASTRPCCGIFRSIDKSILPPLTPILAVLLAGLLPHPEQRPTPGSVGVVLRSLDHLQLRRPIPCNPTT